MAVGLGRDASTDAGSVSCTSGTVALTLATPVLMLVLDRSGSMGGRLGQTNGTDSRWQILTTALASSLPPVASTMEIGALVFPSATQGFDCAVDPTVDLAPQLDQVAALVSLMQSTTPGGATPTALAIDSAARQLFAIRAATTARALVLATDGAPNCNAALDPATCTCAAGNGCVANGNGAMCLDEARTVETIGGYEAQGLPTYVIGIEDSNDAQFADVLSAMAIAGGRPQSGATSYYAGRSEADLDAALVAIRNQVGACVYLTSSVPDTNGTILVTLDGAVIPYDATGVSGWEWANRANGQILLGGAACSAASASATGALQAQVTCSENVSADASIDGQQ